jgi:hypothetical protein
MPFTRAFKSGNSQAVRIPAEIAYAGTDIELTVTRLGLHMDDPEEDSMDDKTRIELEAAAYRALVAHLRKRTDVQNIDLMNLSGFCRNCLSKWYKAAAEERGLKMEYEEARELVYGMPYAEWKDKHQKEASPEQAKAFQQAHKH